MGHYISYLFRAQAALCLTPWLSALQLDLQGIVSKEYNVVRS